MLTKNKHRRIWAFRGEVGVGKTRLIQSICKELGVKEAVKSPSYTLINEYKADQNKMIAHMDFYRLKTSKELLEIGWDYYLASSDYLFIEWPQIAQNELPSNTFWLTLSRTTNKEVRTLTYEN